MAGLSRLETAKSRLTIDWRTRTTPGEQKLDAASALRELHGNDPRPLLVMRAASPDEKKAGKKLEGLIQRSFANEKVQLASQWFHCVRVGADVLDERHPLHSLFAGRRAPRVILASRNGPRKVEALGSPRDKLDWQDLVSVLRADYAKSPQKHVKELQRVLNDFDRIDGLRRTVIQQLEAARAKGKTSSVRKLEKKLARIDKEHAEAVAREKKFRDLGLES